jgi:GntR family transcriptional repressor for pyruvate dehydrogenase complex
MKIIEVRQGDGTYVTDLRPEELVEHLEFVFLLDDSTMLQLFEARKIVEVGNIGLAAERVTDEEIRVLEGCVEKSENCLDDPDAFLIADLELHEAITKAARNPLLERFMASISTLGRASRKKTVPIADVRMITVRHHRNIVQALKARNPDLAKEAMLRHLEQVEKSYYQSGRYDDDC